MLQWKIAAPKVISLVQSVPTVLTDTNNIKIKVEHILYNAECHSHYINPDNVTVPCSYAVGVVSETLDNTMLTKMDRVLLEPNIACNTCTDCTSGNSAQCKHMTELGRTCDGVLSNFVDVPASQLHRLPEQLDYDQALLVPFVSLGINIVDALTLAKGSHVAVFADSNMGLIVAQLVSYYKAVPILISNDSHLIDIAKNKLGIFYAFDSNNCDINREIQVVTGGRMCSEVIYLGNCHYPITSCIELASIGATICLSGKPTISSSLSVSDIVEHQLTITGVHTDSGNYQTAINLIITNQVIIDDIIVEHTPFASVDSTLANISDYQHQLPIIIDVE